MYRLFVLGWLFFTITACQKEGEPNPFNNQDVNQDTVRLEIIDPEPASIAGIYQNVFRPTCANVGCHDGTFEPDFRNMESAYNTLVFQEPIKNDGNYTYRVDPGNPGKSAIMARLDGFLTPQMPIQVEPDSDWPQKGDTYIENIRTWIANGAPDIDGVVRQKNYPAPILTGAGAVRDGNWLIRTRGTGPILVPLTDTAVQFYFAFRHDVINPRDFTYNKVVFSNQPDALDSTAMSFDLEVLGTPRIERGFYGNEVEYTHRVRIDSLNIFDAQYDQWYMRVYVQDDQNPVTEIPTDNGIFYVKSYMSFRWTE